MAKKVMGPGPKKKMQADSRLDSKKGDSYFYAEGVRGGGQGGIKSKSLSKEQKQGMFNASLVTGGSKNPAFDPSKNYPSLYGAKKAVKSVAKKAITKKK
jgi:hypothetical protein